MAAPARKTRKKKPAPLRPLWSQSALARELQVDRRTVRQRLAEVPPDGEIRSGVPGWYLATAAPAVLGLRPQADGGADPDVSSLSPKEQFDYYRAQRERIRLEQDTGLLLPVHRVEAEWARVMKAVVTKLDTLMDVLERDCGLPGPAVERGQIEIDRLREQLSAELLALGESPSSEEEKGGGG